MCDTRPAGVTRSGAHDHGLRPGRSASSGSHAPHWRWRSSRPDWHVAASWRKPDRTPFSMSSVATARQPLTVEAVGADRPLVGRVVDDAQHGRGDHVPHPICERRSAALHRLARQRAAEHAEQRRAQPRFEHDAEPGRRRLGRPQQPGGSRGRVGPDLAGGPTSRGSRPVSAAAIPPGSRPPRWPAPTPRGSNRSRATSCESRWWSTRRPPPSSRRTTPGEPIVTRGSAARTSRSSSIARSIFSRLGRDGQLVVPEVQVGRSGDRRVEPARGVRRARRSDALSRASSRTLDEQRQLAHGRMSEPLPVIPDHTHARHRTTRPSVNASTSPS